MLPYRKEKRIGLEGRGNKTVVKIKGKGQGGRGREGRESGGERGRGGGRELDVLIFDSPSFPSIGWPHLLPMP